MGRRNGIAWIRVAITLLVATGYLVATSGMAFLLVPAHTKAVATADFLCAAHTCDCRTAEQCAALCCCFPVDVEIEPGCPMHAFGAAASEPITVNVTAFAAARCTGATDHAPAFSRHRIEPHERCAMPERARNYSTASWDVAPPRVPASPYVEGPDKVPISLS